MENSINIKYPESLALSLKMKHKDFITEIKTISIIKLYELEKISSGQAAKLLDINRLDFLELLHKYDVSYFNNGLEDELEIDVNNA